MTDIADFLLARMNDMEVALSQYKAAVPDHPLKTFPFNVIAEEFKINRAIIEWHKNWPILVEKPAEFSVLDDFEAGINDYTMRMSRQIMWATEQAYVEKFGSDPPSATLLQIMAQPYRDHPDYRSEWDV